jgi:hypothetical protein
MADVSKKSEPSFDIRIKASSDDEFAMTLGVVLVATYPKSPPLLTIKDAGDLRDSTRFKIQKFVETQPKIWAAEQREMIDGLVEGIREILEAAALKKAQGLELPSLEEERAAHEAELARQARDEKELEERKKLEEIKEEERGMSPDSPSLPYMTDVVGQSSAIWSRKSLNGKGPRQKSPGRRTGVSGYPLTAWPRTPPRPMLPSSLTSHAS